MRFLRQKFIKLNPKIMEEMLAFKKVVYNVQNNTSLKIGNLKTVYSGTKSLTKIKIKNW